MSTPELPLTPNEAQFIAWKKRVDANVEILVGLSADDLPDCPYRDWYDGGVNARTAAKRAVKQASE